MKQIMLAQTEEYSNSSSYYINGCSTESLEDGSSSDEINGALFGGDDIIADDILSVYEPDGYGNMNYDNQRVMTVLLDDNKKNITMWPMMRWATYWNPKVKYYKVLYDKYEQMAWDEDTGPQSN